MTSVADLPNRSFAVLAALGRTGPMSMKEFTEAAGILAESAKGLRVRMEALGLVEVRSLGRRGVVERMEIRLTPLGARLARLACEMDDLLAEGAEKASRAEGR